MITLLFQDKHLAAHIHTGKEKQGDTRQALIQKHTGLHMTVKSTSGKCHGCVKLRKEPLRFTNELPQAEHYKADMHTDTKTFTRNLSLIRSCADHLTTV